MDIKKNSKHVEDFYVLDLSIFVSIKTFHFSTLYTTTLHAQLKHRLKRRTDSELLLKEEQMTIVSFSC